MATTDRAAWDERYAKSPSIWGAAANIFVMAALEGRTPGRALDLACGEGRNAMWLAGKGWHVDAVDFSAVALAKARARSEAAGLPVEWIDADVTEYGPKPAAYDAVLIAYLQLPAATLEAVLARAAAAVAPGGVLVVVGHDEANLTDGVGGPQDPDVLYSVEKLTSAVAPLRIERAERVERHIPGADRPALDALLIATRR